MNYEKRQLRKNGGDAVSPVVGVMLMLVVTIIIAAVVSGFSGGLIGDADKAPALTMDITIKNTGYYATSLFKAEVLSVTEPISTGDLKMVTSWSSSDVDAGGAEVTAATNVFGWAWRTGRTASGTAPWGYGQGVKSVNTGVPITNSDQQFGNYVLLGGTTMLAYPCGQDGGFIANPSTTTGYGIDGKGEYAGWTYSAGTTVDGMQAVLGEDWQTLQPGDVVTVKLVHLPTGYTIFEKSVVVS